MVSFAQPTTPAAPSRGPGVSRQRLTLFDLFQQYRPVLSGLPGDTSQFDQTEIGFEWRCELALGAGRAGQRGLQIHFHLIELEALAKPAAVLYLVEASDEGEARSRLPLPLENLTETHEQLNENLAGKGASIAVFEQAGLFIAALTNVKAQLVDAVAWV